MRARLALAAPALAAALAAAGPAAAEELRLPEGQSVFAQLEAFGAALNDAVGGSNLTASLGWAGRAGWRRERIGFFAEFARDHWLTTEVETALEPGALCLGVGAELRFAGERVRVSAAGGSSTLLFDTAFHRQGTTGFYVDLRPVALRFRPAPWLVVELTPIGFALVAPALGALAIRRIEYRTTLTLEVPL